MSPDTPDQQEASTLGHQPTIWNPPTVQIWDMELRDADYAALPPLVRKGAIREEVISQLVGAWSELLTYPPLDPPPKPSTVAFGITLDRVALYDANSEEAIDLGDIVREVLQKFSDRGSSSTASMAYITLRGCRIDKCDLRKLTISASFTCIRCRFGDGDPKGGGDVSFDSVRFENGADFGGSIFGDHVGFWNADFGKRAHFAKTRFGEKAVFPRARFGAESSFSSAQLGDIDLYEFDGRQTNFDGVTFGKHRPWLLGASDHRRSRTGVATGVGRYGRSVGWYLWSNAVRWFSWNTVRSLGELRILTRVSYIALVIVPMLAAVWGAVDGTISRYERGMLIDRESQVTTRADNSGDSSVLQPTTHSDSSSASDGMTGSVNGVLTRIAHPVRFPKSWALAFFSALLAVAGHLVYQLFAPAPVKLTSCEDFTAGLTRQFNESDPNYTDKLLRAMLALYGITVLLPYHRHQCLLRRHGRTQWIPCNVEFFSATTSAPDAALTNNSERMRVVIEEGARAEYEIRARDRLGIAWFAFSLYVTAAVLILVVAIEQSLAIARAAGW